MNAREKITVFWGLGNNGHMILNKGVLENEFRDVPIMFCDNDTQKQGQGLPQKIPVIGFEKLLELYKNNKIDKIVLTVSAERDILCQCLLAGIENADLYFWDLGTDKIKPILEKHIVGVCSQDGEELFLKEFFSQKTKGTYVDIGANHPFRFSNTYWAYSRGWRGINIEPDHANYELLRLCRKEDININCGISDEEAQLDYYMFKEACLNTFCIDEIENREDIIGVCKIPVRRLDTILEEYDIHEIDFMDIDVEGMELRVLQSIDWDKVTIRCLLVEQRNMSLHEVLESDICRMLESKGYLPVNKYNRTVIYIYSD